MMDCIQHLEKIESPLCQLGEGLCWDMGRNSVWWLDIEGMKIYTMCMQNRTIQTYDTDTIIGCLVLDDNNRLLAYNDLEIQAFDDVTHAFTKCSTDFTKGFYDVLSNDGATDRQGRLLLGTKHTQCAKPSAGLQSVCTVMGIPQTLVQNITVANGPAFSPDGTVMYFADTPTGIISAYDYDIHTGRITNHRVFAKTPSDTYPDGMTVDADGYIWQALWNGGKVLRYAPDGTVVADISIPDALHITNICFGGADMQTIFIITAYSGMTNAQRQAYPNSGAVFMARASHTRGILDTPARTQG